MARPELDVELADLPPELTSKLLAMIVEEPGVKPLVDCLLGSSGNHFSARAPRTSRLHLPHHFPHLPSRKITAPSPAPSPAYSFAPCLPHQLSKSLC